MLMYDIKIMYTQHISTFAYSFSSLTHVPSHTHTLLLLLLMYVVAGEMLLLFVILKSLFSFYVTLNLEESFSLK
jgi:hypothetical protein